MKVKVEVTQEHIDKGTARNCRRCPIAQALYDLGLAPGVWVESGEEDGIFLGYWQKETYQKRVGEDGDETVLRSRMRFYPFAVAKPNQKASRFISKLDAEASFGGGKKASKPFSMTLSFIACNEQDHEGRVGA